MSLPRIILLSSVALFVTIGTVAAVKKLRQRQPTKEKTVAAQKPAAPAKKVPMPATQPVHPAFAKAAESSVVKTSNTPSKTPDPVNDFPNVDRMHQVFSTKSSRLLPIVETITYSSRVDWLKGRPAWIADYAAHYGTSRHFIARSLNAKADYFTQKVSTASRFNVFRRDKEIQFYLLVDLARCKMALYYLDVGTNERVLLKTYTVGLGKPDPASPSGFRTPLGTYSLGNKIAIYKPGMNGLFMNKSVEMVRVFGTRWIPFEQEFEGCTAPAKGFGLQGTPFIEDPSSGHLVENRNCVGSHDSDGCIRLNSEDIEEIFSVVITKPAFVVVVKDFRLAKLPGVEVATPSR